MQYRHSGKTRALMLFENFHGVSLGVLLASEIPDMRNGVAKGRW